MLDPKVFKAYDVRGIYPGRARRGRRVRDRARLRPAVRAAADRGRPRHAALVPADGGGRDRAAPPTRAPRCSTSGSSARRCSISRSASSGSTAGSMVTASHNPKEYTGMKIVRRGALPVGGESGLLDVRDRALAVADSKGGGDERVAELRHLARVRRSGAVLHRRVRAAAAQGRDRRGERDGGRDAAAGARAPADVEAVRCYFDPDGSFPNHEPNPLLPENREFIVAQDARGGRRPRRRVRRRRRPLLLRRRQRRVRARATSRRRCSPRSVLEKEPGAKIIYDVRASWAVPETIERAGGVPLDQPRRARVHQAPHAQGRRRVRRRGLRPLLLPRVLAGRLGRRAVPAHARADLEARREAVRDPARRSRSQYFITGEMNTPVADVALKLQELKERYAAEGDGLASRRHLRRRGRLALQRAAVEHGAAAAAEPRSALAGADGAKRDEVLALIRS